MCFASHLVTLFLTYCVCYFVISYHTLPSLVVRLIEEDQDEGKEISSYSHSRPSVVDRDAVMLLSAPSTRRNIDGGVLYHNCPQIVL